METVKVDVRKLQLLNDRVNQCIDALTQVRQSVHGYQPAIGMGHTTPYGIQPPVGLPPQAAIPFAPYAQVPQAAYAMHQLAPQITPQIPGFAPPFGASPWAGLSHSALPFADLPWQRAVEPALALRVAQSFPYAFSPLPPVLSI